MVVVVVVVMGRPLKLAGEICRGVGRVLGDGLALRLLSSGVRGTTTTTSASSERDSFRFDTRAARFGAAVPPMYLSTRIRALDVRA
jgi:hypothetical protein